MEREDGTPFVFYETIYPEGRNGMVSLAVIQHNITSDFVYNTDFLLLKKHGLKATFYLNALFANPVPDYMQKRLKEYIDDGQEIGLYIRNGELDRITSADELLSMVNKCADELKQKFGMVLHSIYFEKNFGSYPLDYNFVLEHAGYYVNNRGYYLSTYYPNTEDFGNVMQRLPEEVGSEAEKNNSWECFQLAFEAYNEENDLALYHEQLFQDLQKRNLYIAPFGICEKFRRNRVNSEMRILKSSARGFSFCFSGADDASHYFVCRAGFSIRLSKNCTVESKIRLKDGRECKVYRVIGNGIVTVRFSKPQEAYSRMRALNLPYYINHCKASCVFTFDDTNEEQYKSWYPLLKNYGLPATFFLYSCAFDTSVWNSMHHEFLNMQNDGYEIGCHSYSHMPKDYSPIANHKDFFEADTRKAADSMKKNGFFGSSYCFPGNYHTWYARDCVRNAFSWIVRNERNVLRATAFQMNAEKYMQLLLERNDSWVEMIHTPIYKNEYIMEMYRPFFKILSENRSRVSVTTFAAMKTHEAIRNRGYFEIMQSTEHDFKFRLDVDESNGDMNQAKIQLQISDPEAGGHQSSGITANINSFVEVPL